MRRNLNNQKKNKGRYIVTIALIILIILLSIVILKKTSKSNKIDEIKLETAGMTTINIGNATIDVTNQIALTPNKPVLSAGMIPIKYKDGYWVITTSEDPEWYDYKNGKMANIMLNDGVYQSEQVADMIGKKIAQKDTRLQESEMGTVFVWVPKFAYNSDRNILYLKAASSIAGEYITSDIFTYKASAANAQDIALRGIWVEKESGMSSSVISSINTENNTYGIIANTKANRIILDEEFINSINQTNETGIKNTTDYKAILKVVDEKLTEPIMANLSAKGKNVTIKITKADNGIKEVRAENGDVLQSNNEKTEFEYTVDKAGINKFIIIDNIGNQRLYEVLVISPEIYVITNQDNYVEFNGVKWYPYGTQIQIKYAEDMNGLTAHYQEINGTSLTPTTWTNIGTYKNKNFTLYETMLYKAKIENKIGETVGEDEQTIHIMPRGNYAIPTNYYVYNVGGVYPVQVTGIGSGSSSSAWQGTETYTNNTQIDAAATHMGLLKSGEQKTLYIKIVPSPQGGYIGSTRNGLSTSSYTYNNNGYIFVTEQGEEIKLPTINNILQKAEDDKVTVTVDAISYNTDKTIEKYYYTIDNGDIIESDSNVYAFEGIKAYQSHTISVYVKDSFGLMSETNSIITKTANAMPTPTIEIVDEEKLETMEYDGKVWYPYRTQVKINFVDDMTNLTGYYKTINETTGEEISWSTTKSNTYSRTTTESITYIAKLVDSAGAETEEVRFTIYIMPYTSGTLQGNYYNNIGAIYPVRVTGNSSYTIYGTETYMYSSYIQTAAVHMGLLKKDETKNLYIKIVKSPEGGYWSSNRNGITSSDYSSNYAGYNGYIFVTEDGTECKLPIIESAVLTAEEDKITATVTATTNLGEIQKYYYSIDDGTFVESDSNIYTFENVQAYQSHKVQVYVKNSIGIISDTTSVTGKTANNIPIPKIEIVDEDKLETIEYDGKIWYPYNTHVKVIFAEDMTNLTGYYKYIYDESGTETGYSTTSSPTITLSFQESGSKVVKLVDKLNNESEEVSIHLNIMAYQYNLQAAYYNYGLNKIYPVRVTANSRDTIYGTDIYKYDSYIRSSAQHMGLVNVDETKDLYIKIVESPEGGYKGSTKNGVQSNEFLESVRGYTFVTKDGTEIKSPTLGSLTATGGENTITATLQMNYYNGASENKYYYSIDGGTYIESTSNVYTLENVIPYQNHTINVYAKDSNGAVSEVFTTTAKTANEVPVPIIEIVDKDTLETVEYNGKTWYPYGTQVKITYAENITNLTPYYRYVYEASGGDTAWPSDGTNLTRTFSATETTTYYAKNVDKTGEEAINQLTINIMPGDRLQSNYATYCVGEIFPVIVTGSTSGTIYGTDIYSYNSYISKAAMQMGILQDGEKKKLFVKVVKNSDDYYKSVRKNGINSSEYLGNGNGYIFVTEDGTEIKYPTIEKLDIQLSGNNITATIVDAKAYNGATIEKYYYRINNGEYIESNSNSYTFTDLQNGYYVINAYIKDSKGIASEIQNKNEAIANTIATLSGKELKSYSEYAFSNDETSIIPENGGGQGNKHNTIANSYIELDLTGSSSVYKITVNAEASSEGNCDVGYATVSKTSLIPSYTDSIGRFVYISGSVSATNYSINIQGGKKYYIHFGYRKDGSVDKYKDLVKFNSINVEKTSETSFSAVNSGGANEDNIATGEITMSVPGDTTYIEYKGEKWYPYGTKVTINYTGTGTRTHYYAYRNEITGSTSSWSSNSTTTTWSTSVYESTTYFAKITDSSGNIVAEKSMKINILPDNTGIQNNYVKVGNIYPVLVSYYTGGNLYGTNIYSASYYKSYINTAATHMGLVKQGETNKLLYIKIVNYPSGGYTASIRNGVTSSSNNSGYPGFVFVDENGEEIKNHKKGEAGAMLSGYEVINNGGYNFINEENSIIPENGKFIISSNSNATEANSYIELDLTNYQNIDTIKVTLNAEISSAIGDYGYALVTKNTTAPKYYNDARSGFVYITGIIAATDYSTMLQGGQKYYLHMGYYQGTSVNSGEDVIRFNSLAVEKVDEKPTITIDSTAESIEYNGEKWYPYGTNVTITYPEEYDKYYELQYPNGKYYSSGSVTDTNTRTFTIGQDTIIKAGFLSENLATELKINIMAYQYGVQSKYVENVGKIYPVQVTGTSSYTIYGTGKYRYNSAISCAAVHMGLVKEKETKVVYIKIVEFPEGGYKGNAFNGITSQNYTKLEKGYVFVDENGNEISEPKQEESNVKLSGYNVYKNNSSYYFKNNGESIRGVGYYYSNAYPANSYIELDYSNYTENDLFKITLNAENTDRGYAYATITTNATAPQYSDSTGRFVYITKQKEAENYQTIIKGGQKYYLHLGRYHNSSYYSESYYAQFNSLSVEPILLTEVPTIEIDPTAKPIEYKGELWYPYGTKIIINYGLENYTNVSINNNNYCWYKYKNEISDRNSNYYTYNGNYITTLSETTTFWAKYSENSKEVSLKINIMLGNTYSSVYADKVGCIYPIQVTGTGGGPCGNNVYAYRVKNGSNTYYPGINSAATHMGLVNVDETKVVLVKFVKSPIGGYVGVRKNNITSNSATSSIENGYVFVTEDGTEIYEPIINSATSVIGSESTIVTTINSVGQNGASVNKYYYSIDNGAYIESNENTYTFTEVDAYKTHTVRVYVRDNNGAVSQTSEIATTVITNNVTPTITIDESVTPIEYKGELWYPYGTNITIKFADDMNNLTGHYMYIDERNSSSSSWATTSNTTYTTTLNYSVTYVAKMSDSTGRETDEVSKTIHVMPNATGSPGASYYCDYIGNIYPVQVTGTAIGSTYGTDYYYYASNISKAATHMGLVDIDETKVLQIKMVKVPEGGYKGSTRNGITTEDHRNTYNGFVFVNEDGVEITRPKVNSIVTTSGDNLIAVTVDAKSNNGTIQKYYYNIDNGEYVETEDNIYTFTNVTTSGAHIIKVYVKDSNGDFSSIKEIRGRINIPIPTITFNQEPVIYNGEKWYPYGTQITINYSQNMSSLTGYYRYINVHTNSMDSWKSPGSSSYSTTLYESYIYEAYIYESGAGEGEHIRETINIMPNPDRLQDSYYNYGSGKTYPVTITGKTGSGYGTDTYCAYYYSGSYFTPIGVAAVHNGLVKVGETKTVYIKIVPCPEGGYKGSTRNGITTSSLSIAYKGYVFDIL